MDNELKLSLFPTLRSYTSKAVGMEEVVRLLRHDTIVSQKTEAYRHLAQTISRDEANRRIKSERMEAFSVGVLFNGAGRQPEQVLRFTGLAMCDIDHVEGEHLEEAKARITADPHTLLCYTTISGTGLRVIYRYRRDNSQTPDGVSWRAAFLAGNEHYARLTGCAFDRQCSDYGRLSALAHDAGAFFNPDAEPFVITDELILAANFPTGGGHGKARREQPPGTEHCTVEQAWEKVGRMLSARGLAYAPHHRHDYVLHASYLFNRFGVESDELREWAAREWADLDGREREALITHCYRREDEHGTWQVGRRTDRRRENSMITIAEIRQWLTERVEVIYNMVTDYTMFRQKGTDAWQPIDERALASLRAQMAVETDKRVLKNDVYDVIKSDFARLVHPVRDYVEALPAWDGTDRVREVASHLHAEAVEVGQTDAEAQEALGWAFHKWLVATVATWMSDEASNHGIFVLIGSQGIYKTTFFRHLLPPELRSYFWENGHNSFTSKDDHLALAENCLVEIEEVDAASPRDLSELKALVTSVSVKERRPYARFREEKHRLASFCASGNQQRFLTDDTGNRRWLCFKVGGIDDPREWALDYGQLYAQLRDEWRAGFRYWFDPDEQRRVEQLNAPFRLESDEEQLIRTRLRPPCEGDPVKLMNAATICQLLNGGHIGHPLSSRKVAAAMRKLGFPDCHTRRGTFFRVFEIPYGSIQSALAAEVSEEESVTE